MYYGDFRAVTGVNLVFGKREITALIGPSGCGKSTLIRCLNRMNDLIDGARVDGLITFDGEDMYGKRVDPIEVRRRIGMVFQKPNPFPKSIFDNVAYGPRVTGMRVESMDDLVEEALTKAALWGEVKDKLKQSAFGLSGGQQQRLCIARTIAVKPDVILMDEPCSALDPIATTRIEDLMHDLREEYTIVIVTHNMQQAARVADRTAFFTALADGGHRRPHRCTRGVRQDHPDLRAPARPSDRGLHQRAVRMRTRPATHWIRASRDGQCHDAAHEGTPGRIPPPGAGTRPSVRCHWRVEGGGAGSDFGRAGSDSHAGHATVRLPGDRVEHVERPSAGRDRGG